MSETGEQLTPPPAVAEAKAISPDYQLTSAEASREAGALIEGFFGLFKGDLEVRGLAPDNFFDYPSLERSESEKPRSKAFDKGKGRYYIARDKGGLGEVYIQRGEEKTEECLTLQPLPKSPLVLYRIVEVASSARELSPNVGVTVDAARSLLSKAQLDFGQSHSTS